MTHEELDARGVPEGSERARETWLKIIDNLSSAGQWGPEEIALVRSALICADMGVMPRGRRAK